MQKKMGFSSGRMGKKGGETNNVNFAFSNLVKSFFDGLNFFLFFIK